MTTTLAVGTRLEETSPSPLQLLAPLAALLFVAAVVASGAGSTTVWYVIRGTGIIAFLLLTLSVMLGLLITNRVLPSGRPRVDLYEMHIFVALLALAFTTVHGLALLLDQFIGFSVVQILVPFSSAYRPFAVALGILSFYVAGLVYVSFWARRFIGYRAWRALHFASFLAFIMALLHGVPSGSDTHAWWAISQYAVAALAVAGLTVRRLLQRPSRAAQRG
jgi:predicted ferric reductase